MLLMTSYANHQYSIPTKFYCCQTPNGRVKPGAFLPPPPRPLSLWGIPHPVQNRVKRAERNYQMISLLLSHSVLKANASTIAKVIKMRCSEVLVACSLAIITRKFLEDFALLLDQTASCDYLNFLKNKINTHS